MTNDPAPIRELAEQLDDLVDAVARAGAREALPEAVASAWDLDRKTFDLIRDAADGPERREELHRRIARAFEPLARDGVLGPDALPRPEESRLALTVRTESKARTVPKDR